MGTTVDRHPHDISAAEIERALAASENPDLLRELIGISRESFGFFTAHFPHTLNYPWITERLLRLAPGSRLLDIGAGVSPVPLLLARHQMQVTCVDSHSVVRELPATPDWNEWGFFDYSVLDPNIVAIQGSVLDLEPADAYHGIYSISVLAHMPAQVREATLQRCWHWLHPGGSLLLAIDLIPASDFVWNLSAGKIVEPLMRHGTSDEVLAQLQSLGFEVREHPILRCVHTSRTDLMLVHAQKIDHD